MLLDTMFDFRSKLSTEDVLLQIKEEILNRIFAQSENTFMAIEFNGAFDNISHDTIFGELSATNCGWRTVNYAKAFLTSRTASIEIVGLRS